MTIIVLNEEMDDVMKIIQSFINIWFIDKECQSNN